MLLEPDRTEPATEYFAAVLDILSAGFTFFCPEKNLKDFSDLTETLELVSTIRGRSITIH